MLNAHALLGTHDVLFVTLDTLRYDVAQSAWREGRTPFFAGLLPPGGWELRHSPGNFTFAAHCAFFAGFLPTPARPGLHARLFAARFAGSETTTDHTLVFDAPDIVSGFGSAGYATICVGGVGFFNRQTPLGCVLPGLFERSFWSVELGVTSPDSTERQVALARRELAQLAPRKRAFLFVNVSAIHQPNCIFSPGHSRDSPATMADALCYVDRELAPLVAAMRRRAPLLGVICADHGTAYGEDGFQGHRVSVPSVWNVPYAEFVLPQAKG